MRRTLITFVCLLVLRVAHAQDAQNVRLPDFMALDAQRIGMIYCFLDAYADSLWPGWKGYRQTRFRFVYPNRVEMFLGDSAPPPEYQKTRDERFPQEVIAVRTTEATSFPVHLPMVGGGRMLNQPSGKPLVLIQYPIQTLVEPWMIQWHEKKNHSRDESFRLFHLSEWQMMAYVHEIFHVFQELYPERLDSYTVGDPNDLYAACVEVEGLALEGAFLEKDPARSKKYIEDFLMARRTKHELMSEGARKAEQHAERNEGLSTYVQLRLPELLRSKNECTPGPIADLWYFEFRDAEYFLELELETLRWSRATTMDLLYKPYVYGYYQARLLDRFLPGWKKTFRLGSSSLTEVLKEAVHFASAGVEERVQRLEKSYRFSALRNKHARTLAEGANAVQNLTKRTGMKYILDFSRLGHLNLTPRDPSYVLDKGEKICCPRGVERVAVYDFSLITSPDPMLIDGYYMVQWIDPDSRAVMKLDTEGVDEGGLYRNAVVKTDGFELKAPRLRILKTEQFVKLIVFSATR